MKDACTGRLLKRPLLDSEGCETCLYNRHNIISYNDISQTIIKTMVCPPVRGDNLLALTCGLSAVQAE